MVTELVSRLTEEIAEGRAPEGERVASVRSVAARERCSPRSVVRAYAELRKRGLIVARDRARAVVAPGAAAKARASRVPDRRALRLAGSDDPALDVVVRELAAEVAVTGGARGSLGGLASLTRGHADVAAVHLLDAESGRHNDPFVRRLMPGGSIALVHLWRREQGLVLPRRNPRAVRGLGDLEGLRLAWRAPGTGSRLLFELLLREAGVVPQPEAGTAADSHLGVAAAVAAGAADGGLAVRACADALDLDFVALVDEPFELAVEEGAVDRVAPLLDAIGRRDVAKRLDRLGGYDRANAGAVRRAA
jgi:putative molybdopterin biosynthesis protein